MYRYNYYRKSKKNTAVSPKTRTFEKGLHSYFFSSSVSKLIHINCVPLSTSIGRH